MASGPGGDAQLEGFTEEEMHFLLKKFQGADADANGQLEMHELIELLGANKSPLTERIIAALDENTDQRISFSEFVKGLTAVSLHTGRDKRLRLLFKIYDIDGDGFISNGDLFKSIVLMTAGNLNERNLQQLVDRAFQQGDIDGDGLLSFDEFKNMASKSGTSSPGFDLRNYM